MYIPNEILNTIWYVCAYSLMAIPLTLSYRISKVMNFSHGVLVTLGAYASILITTSIGTKISPLLAIPLAFVVGGSIAVVGYILVFGPLIRKKSSLVTLMIASVGAWIFIKYAFYAFIDVLQKMWMKSLFYASPNLDLQGEVNVLGINMTTKFAFVVTLTIVSLSLLAVFLTKTKLGMALRAVADNPTLAQISGISSERVMIVTWMITGGLAAIGGLVFSIFTYVSPEVGDIITLQIFACAVIGGLTSIPLTFAGAGIISSTENIIIVLLYRYAGIELSFRPFLSFLVLIVTILLRPPAGAGGGLPYRFRRRLTVKRGDS